MAPQLEDFKALRVSPSILRDAEAALRALTRLPDYPTRRRPDLMSVSFGSAAALHLAGSDEFTRHIGRTFIFGGFADWHDTIRFSVAGREALPHDPLNRPVVYLNLLPHFGVGSDHHQDLTDGWRTFCERTWGQPEMKERAAYQNIAAELAHNVAPDARDLFLEGCSCNDNPEDAVQRCDVALEHAGDTFAWLDPRPHLESVRSPTYLIHGRDDDVIPYTEAARLASCFPADNGAEVLITGLYSHTRQDDGQHGASGKWQELKTLSRILKILAGAQ